MNGYEVEPLSNLCWGAQPRTALAFVGEVMKVSFRNGKATFEYWERRPSVNVEYKDVSIYVHVVQKRNNAYSYFAV